MKHESGGNIKTSTEKIYSVAVHLCLIIAGICCLYPFLVILGSSFQSQDDIVTKGYSMIPQTFSLDAFKIIFADPHRILNAYKMTIITTVLGTLCGLYCVSTCGYVMSRGDYPYKRILSFYVFFTMLFNGGLVPTYILITRWLGLKNSIFALILPGMCTAWNIMLMKGFFQSIPTSLIESAKIDGAGEFRIFAKIVVPLAKPAFATIGLLLVLTYWNEWYYSLLYIDDESKVKLQYLLMTLMRNIEFLKTPEAMEYSAVNSIAEIPTLSVRMAMCVLAAGPILIVFPFFQKYFVKGLTVGAVKG
jgi:putative aldouronate transport system permease protein